MNTTRHISGTSYSAITPAQRDALVRRGNALRAEAFAHALSSAARLITGRSRKPAGAAGPVVERYGTQPEESGALLSRKESWVEHDGRNAA